MNLRDCMISCNNHLHSRATDAGVPVSPSFLLRATGWTVAQRCVAIQPAPVTRTPGIGCRRRLPWRHAERPRLGGGAAVVDVAGRARGRCSQRQRRRRQREGQREGRSPGPPGCQANTGGDCGGGPRARARCWRWPAGVRQHTMQLALLLGGVQVILAVHCAHCDRQRAGDHLVGHARVKLHRCMPDDRWLAMAASLAAEVHAVLPVVSAASGGGWRTL